MGCGCTSARGVTKQVHPDPSGVVPAASSSASPAPQEAVNQEDVAAVEGLLKETEVAPKVPVEIEPDTPQSLTAPRAEPTPTAPRVKKQTLVKATKDKNLTLMDELLRAGCGLEDLGMWDNTPLLIACSYGYAEGALRLISAKANVHAKNEHGATPMHYAAVEGMQAVVEALLATVRAEGGDADVSKLVNCGAAKVYNRHLDAYAMRKPLSSAAESGFPDVAGILLAAGAILEDVDDDGRTALWLAARHSRLPAVRLLLQHDADPGLKDNKGASVLEAATVGGNEALILELLGKGLADVNDTAGSPLRDAVRSGKRGVVEALLTHGASVELKPGAVGSMPLHAACERGDEYLVSLLVRARADPSATDVAGLTAFDLLRRRGLPDNHIVQLLTPPAGAGEADGCTGATGETADTPSAS